jgi:hypothetical protein
MLYGILCVQTCEHGPPRVVIFRHWADPPADVYSYNFPDDTRFLKFIGGHKSIVCTSVNSLIPPVYFVFFLETLQTALTAADVYYWFVAGFGNADRLTGDSHFYAIDGIAMNIPISLIVQGFYCYRIWTLNKRWLWICVVIAIVRTFPSIV